MHDIPEEAVKAAYSAYVTFIEEGGSVPVIDAVRAALTAALPFLPVQGAVKTGERLPEAEKEITRYQQERDRWINYTIDLQRIIEALCDRRGLPEPISTARHHYDMAREYLSSRAGNTVPALEPSAARSLALGALRSAEQFIENGFEFGFIRKPDEGDTALETLPKIKAAIRDLQSNAADARPLALEEGFRKGLEAACDVIDAHNEYDRRMCCDGRECGCYGATVHQSMQHYIRDLSSPDHADAGKVEGDGCKRCGGKGEIVVGKGRHGDTIIEDCPSCSTPQDVINLVIAAREACDTWLLPECEFKRLDKALDAFSERVPFENEPDALPSAPASEGAE